MKRIAWLCSAATVGAAAVSVGDVSLAVRAQGRGAGPAADSATPVPGSEWTTYGADLASTRYSPLDQINKDNFGSLEIAWRLNTSPFGPRPDNLYSATPLMVNGTLYTTVGTRRGAVALDPGTGEVRWLHTPGARGARSAAPGRVRPRVHRRARDQDAGDRA